MCYLHSKFFAAANCRTYSIYSSMQAIFVIGDNLLGSSCISPALLDLRVFARGINETIVSTLVSVMLYYYARVCVYVHTYALERPNVIGADT